MHEILQSFKFPILGDRHIWYRPWSWHIADVGKHELWVWHVARQCGSQPNCLCQQMSVQCGAAVQQQWQGSTRHITWTHKVPSLLFFRGNICHHWPQGTGSHDQQGLALAMLSRGYSAPCQDAPIQCTHPIQTWSSALHSGLAFASQSCIKLWPRNNRHECEYTQHQHICRCLYMHPNRRYTSSNGGRSRVRCYRAI